MAATHDLIVIGARCAGASLATFLARDGASVLLLDKDKLPSDQVISTHTIHPPGIDVLDELGVGAQVREVAPPGRVTRLAKNDAHVDITYEEGRAEYCPRRERLDGLLQRAAVDAGAELIDRTRVTSLIHENGRVAGVRVDRGGKEQEFRSPLVVGADGRHSTVAQLVGAEEYLGYDGPRGAYWSYWEAPEIWKTDAYPFDMYIGNRSGNVRLIFVTDHNQLLIASAPTTQQCATWRGDPLAALKADLASDPVAGPLVDGRNPVEKVRGTTRERYFFRRAAGPGWVLVGDAGHHKDFLIGDGITEALLQVRGLRSALKAGTDSALETWWRRRDVEALPMFFFAEDEGRPLPPAELQCVVFSHVARDAELKRRMALVMEHQLPPLEAFSVPTVLRWALSAAARGKLRVLREFLQMGKRASAIQQELATRKQLLQRLEAAG